MTGRQRANETTSMQEPAACPPFLRWAGSKRRLLPTLREFWKPEHQRYVEPFAGSACLFFDLQPPKALLGDLNPGLISTFRELKYRPTAVLRELAMLRPFNKEEYLRLRALEPILLHPASRAARFIYLNRFCFNGIYRTNQKGQFNVPYSGDRCGAMPSESTFRLCSRRLKKATFITGDFERVLKRVSKGDFVYMDPPYAIRGRRVFCEYDPSAFSHQDIKRLRSWLDRFQKEKISFVVSYAESEEADILKRGFSHQTIAVRRNIAGFVRNRAVTNEILITNT